MAHKKSRTFNGKRYTSGNYIAFAKSEIQVIADKKREQGYNAVIVKYEGDEGVNKPYYDLFLRKG